MKRGGARKLGDIYQRYFSIQLLLEIFIEKKFEAILDVERSEFSIFDDIVLIESNEIKFFQVKYGSKKGDTISINDLKKPDSDLSINKIVKSYFKIKENYSEVGKTIKIILYSNKGIDSDLGAIIEDSQLTQTFINGKLRKAAKKKLREEIIKNLKEKYSDEEITEALSHLHFSVGNRSLEDLKAYIKNELIQNKMHFNPQPIIKNLEEIILNQEINFTESFDYQKISNILLNVQIPNLIENPEPLNENDEILNNLIKIKRIPRIWGAPTKIRFPKDIYNKCEYPGPFILKDKIIYNFFPYTEYNPLSDFIEENSFEVNIQEWLKESKTVNYLKELIGRWISQILYQIGLYTHRRKKKYYYYFIIKNPSREDVRIEKWNGETGRRNNRTVVRGVRKTDNSIYYYHHRAVRFKFFIIDNEIFLEIIPINLFSKDNKQILTGQSAKKFNGYYQKSLYTRNDNQRNDFLFWYYYLFEHPKLLIDLRTYSQPKRLKFLKNLLKLLSNIEKVKFNSGVRPHEVIDTQEEDFVEEVQV